MTKPVVIQAYRRTKPHTVALFGKLYKFLANAEQHFVCSVDDEDAVERLLEIKDAYRPYGEAVANKVEDEEQEANPYILTVDGDNGEEIEVDLLKLSKTELIKFAKDNEMKPLPDESLKKQAYADAILAWFRVE